MKQRRLGRVEGRCLPVAIRNYDTAASFLERVEPSKGQKSRKNHFCSYVHPSPKAPPGLPPQLSWGGPEPSSGMARPLAATIGGIRCDATGQNGAHSSHAPPSVISAKCHLPRNRGRIVCASLVQGYRLQFLRREGLCLVLEAAGQEQVGPVWKSVLSLRRQLQRRCCSL